MKDTENKNIVLSTTIHNAIPMAVREIVNEDFSAVRTYSWHNVEILDEIIEDLKQYQRTLPSISDLECVGAL